MKVRDVYTPSVTVAYPGESLGVAASRMDYNEIGALVVKDGSRTIGILSERDVLHAVAEDRDLDGTTVAEFMTEDVIPVKLDADVGQAAAAMVSLGARHLPVMGRGEIVGMVSARDLLAVKAWEGIAEILEAEARTLETEADLVR
jgi:CBS domain-containing protein